ncbi:glycoside hydrolase domain-containing protein, partial [Nocardia sp. NPDC051900]|uniref:glycoside hydrolase domain-containing protein n=1 Tax=Nocardia sp. NPDC051900 TaxID=3364326 RepID=UPI0037A93A35
GGPSLPGKQLLPWEADALRAAGIEIVSNWETYADRMRGGYAAGEYDATLALAQVRACGGRDDRPIYFSADWDTTEEEQALINDYLRGAAAVLGVENVGIYGGFWSVSRALDAGVARWAWQTDAWSGGQRDPRINIHQRIQQVRVDGVPCDVNEALTDDYGQWSGGIELVSYDTEENTMDADIIRDIREQLAGLGAREEGYPGWLQLGQNPDGSNRTLVDGLAAALAEIGELKGTVDGLKATVEGLAAKVTGAAGEVPPGVVK